MSDDETEEDEKDEVDLDEIKEDVGDLITKGTEKRKLMFMTLSVDSVLPKRMAKFLAWIDANTDVMVFQTEKGKKGGEQGYKHIQLVCRFKKQTLYSTVRLEMGQIKGWVRGVVGPNGMAKCVNYCSKVDTRIDGPNGTKGKELVIFEGKGRSGTRNDIISFKKYMMENPLASAVDIPEEHLLSFAKYGRLADQLRHYKPVKVAFKRAFCVFGASGVGKTSRAKIMAAEAGMNYYIKDASNLWWDGYNGQECVIVDEVRAGQAGEMSKKILTMFLQLLDPEDAYLAQVKGSFAYITAKLFIFTSPVHPSQWFHHADYEDDPAAQLMRRFNGVKELKDLYQHPKAQEPEQLEATRLDGTFEDLFKDA